ncbi:MAG: vWA domain-containing protein, partial [Flavobacteriales bacterium]
MNKEASFDFGWLDFSWADKHLFWLLLVIPFLVVWYYYIHYKRSQAIRFSSLNAIESSGWNSIPALLFSLRLSALGVLILAFARPQLQEDETFTRKSAEGIDIVMALDISGSMMAEDFKPNRLVVAKEVAINFIKERPDDRIGLVVYEGQAFTQCPLTTD